MDNKNTRLRVVLGTSVFILYVVFIFVLAIIRVPEGVPSFEGLDKLVHFIEYFLLSGVVLKFLDVYKVSGKRLFILTSIIGIVFMLASELVQAFVPGRMLSVYDLLADFLGFFIGMRFFKWIFFRQ